MVTPAYQEALILAQRLTPEEQLRLLEAVASMIRQEGLLALRRSPDQTSVEESGDLKSYDPAQDPLAPFIGAFDSGISDLARSHDAYLAEAHMEHHDDEE